MAKIIAVQEHHVFNVDLPLLVRHAVLARDETGRFVRFEIQGKIRKWDQTRRESILSVLRDSVFLS